jgi:hypothetical protein
MSLYLLGTYNMTDLRLKLNGSIKVNMTALEEVDAELEDLNVQLQELVQYVMEL